MAVLRPHRALTCYARQDKIWVSDPDGTPWEVFATKGDTEAAGACCATAA